VFSQEFQAYSSQAASDEITWKKPRTILVVIAWSIISTSIMLNAFLSGSQTVGYTFWSISTAVPLLLLFLVSVLAGMLLADIRSIVLGIFEALALTILLTYTGIALPLLVGNAPSLYANAIPETAIHDVFSMFFPLIPFSFLIGALMGGFLEDWLF
jgi:hypothetical protein